MRMGKAAENEKIKLRAALWNNGAVGLVLAGSILPMLAVYPRIPELAKKGIDLEAFIPALIASVMAFLAAWYLHSSAIKELDKIQD